MEKYTPQRIYIRRLGATLIMNTFRSHVMRCPNEMLEILTASLSGTGPLYFWILFVFSTAEIDNLDSMGFVSE